MDSERCVMVKGPYSGDVSALALLYWPAITSEAVVGAPLLGKQRRSEEIKGDELVIDEGAGKASSLSEGNQGKIEVRKSDEKVANEGRGNAAVEETRAGAGQENVGSALGNGASTGRKDTVEEIAIRGADASGRERRERPTLLAGMGSQLLWYDLQSGLLLLSQSVFDGVRVHGIHTVSVHTGHIHTSPTSPLMGSPPLERATSGPAVLLVVFGEKRVKVLELWALGSEARLGENAGVNMLQVLPRFSSWVFDARLVSLESSLEGMLAVGLGNNSVSLWDWRRGVEVRRVLCSVECLLYSMALHGRTLADLAVVAGTIYNEVLVWKVDSSSQAQFENSPQSLRTEPLHTLRGHEGSIHRVSWSPDGSKVMSVSDDRSARVWNLAGGETGASAGPILYGHTARIWDCIVGNQFIVTASEDCTCRIWTSEGQLASVFRGHSGRGVWRVLFEPSLCALITGGADSAIKLHPMCEVLEKMGAGGPRM